MRKVAISSAALVVSAGMLAFGSGAMAATHGDAPTTLSMFTSPPAQLGNLNNNEFTKLVEKKFNINFNWTIAPAADELTKQSVILSSGDYPAIFWDGNFTSAQVMQYGQEGVFVPLNNLIKKYAPAVWKKIEDTSELKQSSFAPNGKIYALPNYNSCMHCNFSSRMWVDVKLLDKYHLSMPKTTAEFEHDLEVFKSHNIVPLSGATNGWQTEPITWIMNAFTYDGGQNTVGYGGDEYVNVSSNGKNLIFGPTQPGWKQGLEYLHTLDAKGLISSATFTQDNTQLDDAADKNEIGFVPGGVPPQFANAQQANWELVPPLTGPSGHKGVAFYGNGLGQYVFAITNKSNLQEDKKVLELINYIWTYPGLMTWNFGPEAKTSNPADAKGYYWGPAAKGVKDMNGQQATYWVNTNLPTSNFNAGWYQMGPMYQTNAERYEQANPPPFAPNGAGNQALLQFVTEKYMIGHQPKYTVPTDIWVKPNQVQNYSTLQTNINNYVDQWTEEFITGSEPLSTGWTSYVSGVKSLGLAQYLSLTKSGMVAPFNTSSFKEDVAQVRRLENEKQTGNFSLYQ